MIKRNFTAPLVALGMVAMASVSQAVIVDLIHNDQGTVTNSYGTAIFQFTTPQPTGTGVIQPFLRIQATGVEQGYNTSGGTPFDDKAGPWTHDLKFFSSATDGATTTNISQLGTLRYDLDAGGDNQILFDAGRNHGSGSGDAFMYIPASAFAGVGANDFIYMYVKMGESDDDTAGGFEEFTLVRNMTPVPEMSALFPIVGLLVAVGSTHVLRRRRAAQVKS